MIKVGDMVIISANMHGNKQKDMFVGHTGIISKVNSAAKYPYSVEFDNKALQEASERQGRWIWSAEDLTVLDDDNLGFVR